jgi:hypothetical protein
VDTSPDVDSSSRPGVRLRYWRAHRPIARPEARLRHAGHTLAGVGLALVLSLGLSGTAFAATPVVIPDAVSVPVVVTGPVSPVPGWWRFFSLVPSLKGGPEVSTSGPGLAGTYVGAPGNLRYIAAFQYQLVIGDPQGGFSCTAYSMAMALSKASYGAVRVTGAQIRALSGASAYTGLTLPQAISAAARLHVSIVNESGSGDWADVLDALRHGRGVVLQGDYDQIPARYSGQVSFKGNHAVFVDYLHSSGQFVYVLDPLQRDGAEWVPVAIMRAFAEKLAKAQGIYPRLYYAVTPTTRLLH